MHSRIHAEARILSTGGDRDLLHQQRLARCLRTGSVALLGFWTSGWCSAIATQERVQISIDPGPLQLAVLQLVRNTGIDVVFDPKQFAGLNTRGVDGVFTPLQALNSLLIGLPVCAEPVPPGNGATLKTCKVPQVPKLPDPDQPDHPTNPPPEDEAIVVHGVREMNESLGTQLHGSQPGEANKITLGRDQITKLGFHTADEILMTLKRTFGGGATQVTSQVGGEALSNAGRGSGYNLRDQGAGGTLILINGNRVASSGDKGLFVDVLNIPVAFIKSIEIWPDGTSAIYGSDAVGGVVNFNLLDGSEASQLSIESGSQSGCAHRERSGNVSLAKASSSRQAVILVSHSDNAALQADNDTPYAPLRPPDLLPTQQIDSIAAHAQQYVANTSLMTEALLTHRRATQYYSNLFSLFPEGTTAEVQSARVAVQTLYLAARSKTNIGSQGLLTITMSRSYETEREISQASSINLNDFSEQAAATPLTRFNMFSQVKQLVGKLEGVPISTPAGPVKGVLGAEYRQQSFTTTLSTDPLEAEHRYDRRTTAGFSELTVPLWTPDDFETGMRIFDIRGAGRYEKYSDFGHSLVPQVVARLIPVAGLELTATWGKSLQGPNLPERDESQNAIVTGAAHDALTGALVPVIITSGNNRSLREERAVTRTLSIHWSRSVAPDSLLNLKLSYFGIDFQDRFEAIDLSEIALGDGRYASLLTALTPNLQNQLCDSTQFFGDRSACRDGHFAAAVDDRLQNIDTLLTQGIDFQGDLATRYPWGTLKSEISGTYLLKYSEISTPGSSPVSLLNKPYNPINLLLQAKIEVNFADVDASTTVNHSNNYRNTLVQPNQSVASWTTVDLYVRYRLSGSQRTWLGRTRVSAHLQNAFNHLPPLVTNGLESARFDEENANPTGRTLRIELMTQF